MELYVTLDLVKNLGKPYLFTALSAIALKTVSLYFFSSKRLTSLVCDRFLLDFSREIGAGIYCNLFCFYMPIITFDGVSDTIYGINDS